VWAPDGRSIIFASTREGGDFDLWEQRIERGAAAGEPVQLTTAPDHEVTPTIAADRTIVYAAVRPTGGRDAESHLEERAPDGTIRALTVGPADRAPAFSPDGTTLAFVRPVVHGADGTPQPDSELWRMPRGSQQATQIVDVPLTDESGPVWSHDGRFVFATSVLRGVRGNPLFSSVVVVDLEEKPTRARILVDRAGASARLTPAVAASELDAPALRSKPEYLPELSRIMAREIARQQQQPGAAP
jgi:Tol biopolymer transport system component